MVLWALETGKQEVQVELHHTLCIYSHVNSENAIIWELCMFSDIFFKKYCIKTDLSRNNGLIALKPGYHSQVHSPS